jgi:NADPH:quinone reductase-like Zn-dependent oxidoreductase
MAVATTENLDRIGALLDGGILRVHVQATYELERAPEALEALAGTHTRGKIAIRVA